MQNNKCRKNICIKHKNNRKQLHNSNNNNDTKNINNDKGKNSYIQGAQWQHEINRPSLVHQRCRSIYSPSQIYIAKAELERESINTSEVLKNDVQR